MNWRHNRSQSLNRKICLSSSRWCIASWVALSHAIDCLVKKETRSALSKKIIKKRVAINLAFTNIFISFLLCWRLIVYSWIGCIIGNSYQGTQMSLDSCRLYPVTPPPKRLDLYLWTIGFHHNARLAWKELHARHG